MDSLPRLNRTLFTFLGAALLAGLPGALSAQDTGTLSGMVTDAQSGRPLSEAQVLITGSGVGGLTNASGRYVLLNVPTGPRTVRVELIGYGTATANITVAAGSNTLDFQLAQTAISLNEIVVTGVGQETQRRALGTTVDVIDAQAIQNAPVQNVAQLLQGRVAGATVNATSSQPGTGSLINFRGTSSVVGAQTPVIYIDGVRVDSDQSTADGTGGEQSSALADLMVSDIERIEITKGGAASTLYGSDAATGVIQIFTKKGTPGPPRVTARIEQGVEMPELKYIFDVGLTFPDQVAAGEVIATLMEDEYFRNGHVQSYYVGVNGGTADVTYRLSGRINQGDGTQPKNGNVQYNLSGGMQASLSDKLTVDFGGSYTRSDFERLFNGTAIADPLTTFEVGDALFFSGANDLNEALRIFLLPDITEEVNRFLISAGARYRWTDNVASRLTIGVDNRSNQQRVFEPIGFTPGEVTGELTRFQREFTSVSLDAATTWSADFTDAISSALTIGAQGFRDDESLIEAEGTGFALPGAPDFDAASEVSASENNTELFNGGFYLDEQLSFGDKFFLGGGLRVDAGSTFGDQVDYQAYPKFTGSYVISEESFMEGVGFLDELKLRAAYGETGKFPEPFLRDRSFSAIPFRGESAARFENPGNEDLRPEVTSTVEAGFDAALFNNRVGVNLTWFDATTTDAFFEVPEQPVTGQGTQLRNLGEIKNTGIELAMNINLVNSQNFAWSLGATFNVIDNEVTDMGGAADFSIDTGGKRVSQGKPVGVWWLSTPTDSNGDGLNDDSENQFQTDEAGKYLSPSPDKFGSFNTSITLWNRLNLSALADWAGGNAVFDWGSVWSTFNGIYRREELTGVQFPVRYRLDGSERGRYPQSSARSAFLYDGDWFKVREILARYELPEDVAGSFGVERASVYGSVRNVWIWSRNELIDPELSGVTGGGGIELGGESSITASSPRTFRMGVEVVF